MRLIPPLKISVFHQRIKMNQLQLINHFSSNQKFCKLLIALAKKRKRPDTNAIYEYLKKTEAPDIDKETIGSIITELINQKILENKKFMGYFSFNNR